MTKVPPDPTFISPKVPATTPVKPVPGHPAKTHPKDHTPAPADLVPTPAEYERDAILDREEREEAEREIQAAKVAKDAGELPPAAQTLEEARAARELAKKPKETIKQHPKQ